MDSLYPPVGSWVDFSISDERELCVYGGHQSFLQESEKKEDSPQTNWWSLKWQTSVIPGRKWIIVINVCCLQPRCKSQRHLNYKQLHKLISIILILQKLTSCPEEVKLNVSPRWNLKRCSNSASTTQLTTQLCILPLTCHWFSQKRKL